MYAVSVSLQIRIVMILGEKISFIKSSINVCIVKNFLRIKYWMKLILATVLPFLEQNSCVNRVVSFHCRKKNFITDLFSVCQVFFFFSLLLLNRIVFCFVFVNFVSFYFVEYSGYFSLYRFIECRDKLLPYLRKCGFNPKTDIYFMPCSGLSGAFLTMVPDESVCSWYRCVAKLL